VHRHKEISAYSIVLCFFALIPLADIHHFLFYALSFSVERPLPDCNVLTLTSIYPIISYGIIFYIYAFFIDAHLFMNTTEV
jgi:hypothetical protein